MDNNFQGKRPDQIKSSEQIMFWSFIAMIILMVVLKLIQ
jgi:hypothetical protein